MSLSTVIRFPRVVAFMTCGLIWISTLPKATAVQVISSNNQARPVEPVTRITLQPQPVPRPSLKYQLLPRFVDLRPGNAVVWYGKVKAEQNNFFSSTDIWNQIIQCLETPVEDLAQFEELNLLTGDISIIQFLEYGARSEFCDWQLPVRSEPFVTILLPEIQESRSFGRILAARARIQISRGQYPEAIRTIQTGLALAKHVSQSPTLVSGLVGIAIEGMMLDQLLEMIQRPDSPNMYWALTTLPTPVASLRMGLDAEQDLLNLTFPGLKDLEKLEGTKDSWNQQYTEVWNMIHLLTDSRPGPRAPLGHEGFAKASLIRGYPIAKRVLNDEGLSPETIEKMPVSQVVLAAGIHQYNLQRDVVFRRFFLSYPEAVRRRQIDAEQKNELLNGHPEVLPLAEFILPAIDNVIAARVWQSRRVAALRILEAIRLYAASHEGQLPVHLADITDVPIPFDPVTEQPFEYRLEGDVAYLTGPALPAGPFHFEIRLRP